MKINLAKREIFAQGKQNTHKQHLQFAHTDINRFKFKFNRSDADYFRWK